MSADLTSEQNIALRLIFAAMGESLYNRTDAEYVAVAARTPKLSALHFEINRFLQRMAASGYVPFEISTFKASSPGRDRDRYYRNKKFPTSLSITTIRLAWKKSGMRDLQRKHKRLNGKRTRIKH